jgi:Icc-related predicted phosphoesterase
MKLVIISDTHDKFIKELPAGDVLIHCGDYSLYGEYNETKKFFDWIDSQPHKHKIVIPGNHEVAICPLKKEFSPDYDKIMELIKSYKNVNFLIDKEVIIDGIKFYGTPWCGGDFHVMHRWGFWARTSNQRTKYFSKIPDDTDVLITHTPPYKILDKYQGKILGSAELLKRVKEVKPFIHCFGHIHSANGYTNLHGINFFNCATLGEGYEIQFPCRVIDIADRVIRSIESVPVVDSRLKE